MSLFEQCQQAVSEADILSTGEFDLAQRLYQCISPFSTLKKIKAHRNISEIPSLLDQYHALGNMKANDEAIRARDLLLPEVFKQLDDSCTKVHSQKQRVQLFSLHLELQIARARAKAPGSVETNATHSTNVAVLLNFAPVQEWFFPNVINLEGIAHSAWGRQALHSTLNWLRSCVWTLDITQPENLEPGLSWTEIAVAIILEHGA